MYCTEVQMCVRSFTVEGGLSFSGGFHTVFELATVIKGKRESVCQSVRQSEEMSRQKKTKHFATEKKNPPKFSLTSSFAKSSSCAGFAQPSHCSRTTPTAGHGRLACARRVAPTRVGSWCRVCAPAPWPAGFEGLLWKVGVWV